MTKPRILFIVVRLTEYRSVVCVPTSWIRDRQDKRGIKRAVIAYPDFELAIETRYRVRRREKPDGDWGIYDALIKFEAETYKDAVDWIAKNGARCLREEPGFQITPERMVRQLRSSGNPELQADRSSANVTQNPQKSLFQGPILIHILHRSRKSVNRKRTSSVIKEPSDKKNNLEIIVKKISSMQQQLSKENNDSQNVVNISAAQNRNSVYLSRNFVKPRHKRQYLPAGEQHLQQNAVMQQKFGQPDVSQKFDQKIHLQNERKSVNRKRSSSVIKEPSDKTNNLEKIVKTISSMQQQQLSTLNFPGTKENNDTQNVVNISDQKIHLQNEQKSVNRKSSSEPIDEKISLQKNAKKMCAMQQQASSLNYPRWNVGKNIIEPRNSSQILANISAAQCLANLAHQSRNFIERPHLPTGEQHLQKIAGMLEMNRQPNTSEMFCQRIHLQNAMTAGGCVFLNQPSESLPQYGNQRLPVNRDYTREMIEAVNFKGSINTAVSNQPIYRQNLSNYQAPGTAAEKSPLLGRGLSQQYPQLSVRSCLQPPTSRVPYQIVGLHSSGQASINIGLPLELKSNSENNNPQGFYIERPPIAQESLSQPLSNFPRGHYSLQDPRIHAKLNQTSTKRPEIVAAAFDNMTMQPLPCTQDSEAQTTTSPEQSQEKQSTQIPGNNVYQHSRQKNMPVDEDTDTDSIIDVEHCEDEPVIAGNLPEVMDSGCQTDDYFKVKPKLPYQEIHDDYDSDAETLILSEDNADDAINETNNFGKCTSLESITEMKPIIIKSDILGNQQKQDTPGKRDYSVFAGNLPEVMDSGCQIDDYFKVKPKLPYQEIHDDYDSDAETLILSEDNADDAINETNNFGECTSLESITEMKPIIIKSDILGNQQKQDTPGKRDYSVFVNDHQMLLDEFEIYDLTESPVPETAEDIPSEVYMEEQENSDDDDQRFDIAIRNIMDIGIDLFLQTTKMNNILDGLEEINQG